MPFIKKRLGREYEGYLRVARDANSKWMCILSQSTGTWVHSVKPSGGKFQPKSTLSCNQCICQIRYEDKRLYGFKEGLKKFREHMFSISYQTQISVRKFLFKIPTFSGIWEKNDPRYDLFFP